MSRHALYELSSTFAKCILHFVITAGGDAVLCIFIRIRRICIRKEEIVTSSENLHTVRYKEMEASEVPPVVSRDGVHVLSPFCAQFLFSLGQNRPAACIHVSSTVSEQAQS